eukprot:CAMPEP_0185729096 /NCGR_PEP_ID=MMETSP1171-20130828/4466_1 /TAXON_ID=374046 /ORGANISM="Helicotheca tamensis, Strain CCMP826" /LENGTH=380 /DNA_ID=CAMNT_0028397869 /DNA_START=44 /DNA_END=1183 /DNA_ORIENTATION=-
MHNDGAIALVVELTDKIINEFVGIWGGNIGLLTAYEERITTHNSLLTHAHVGNGTCITLENATTTAETCDALKFNVNNPTETWLVSVMFVFGMCHYIYRNLSLQVTNRHMAYFCASIVAASTYPFVRYMITDQSWTNMKLNNSEKSMIDRGHAVPMFAWVLAATIQMVSYAFHHQKIHNTIGRLTYYFLLPLMFTELSLNAVFVFVPVKPKTLAHVLTGTPMDKVTPWQVFLYSLPHEDALCLPIVMAAYAVLSYKALQHNNHKKRDIRMHIFWMAQFILATSQAGVFRWQVQYDMAVSGCQHLSYQDEPALALIQMLAGDWVILWWTFFPILMYCTLSKETRQNNWVVKSTAYGYMVYGLSSPLSCYVLNIPSGIHCTA